MGSAFSLGGPTRQNTLSESQRNLLPGLGEFFGGQLGVEVPGISELQRQVLGGLGGGEMLAREIFQQGFLDPALRTFDREIAPRIDLGFAGIGGSLSSRRGVSRANALEGIVSSAQGDFARMLPEILGFPARNAAQSAQALGAIQNLNFLPANQALGFLGTTTGQAINAAPGVGFNILGDVLGGAATIASSGVLGSGGIAGQLNPATIQSILSSGTRSRIA